MVLVLIRIRSMALVTLIETHALPGIRSIRSNNIALSTLQEYPIVYDAFSLVTFMPNFSTMRT